MIDAILLKKMFLSAAQALDAKKDWINELNVFPVPDGDTGTNMTMTLMSAVRELANAEEDMASISKAISSGALRGARGNSGVILSQLLRGFSKVAAENETMDIETLSVAFDNAVEKAYKAVMKPKEGTILTVARAVADKGKEMKDCGDMDLFFASCIAEGDAVLLKTPEMLPVLKQAGVVDSGGQGLMVVLHGAYDAFQGKEVDLKIPEYAKPQQESISVDVSNLETSDIKFGYCTEFIVRLEKEFTEEDEDHFKDFLNGIGDSIVCVADEEVVKIHVHTNDPGVAIQKALTYGQLSRIKIDNMREEHQERLFKDAEKLAKEQKEADEARRLSEQPRKEIGFVAVASGDGLKRIFMDLGVDYVIEGGQTMNPSTDDLLNAIRKVNADKVFVLPNNKNIILASEQAARMTSDKEVIVIHAKSLCQGLSCLINYMPEAHVDENILAMEEGMHAVKTLEVTYAIRNTNINGVKVKKGDYMVLGDGDIYSGNSDITEAVKEAIKKTVDEDTAIVSIYYGSEVTEETANALGEVIQELVPDAEVEVNYGGQPVYYYIISVE